MISSDFSVLDGKIEMWIVFGIVDYALDSQASLCLNRGIDWNSLIWIKIIRIKNKVEHSLPGKWIKCL